MKQGSGNSRIGKKVLISNVGERVDAYIPPPLPPNPAVNLDLFSSKLEKASSAIGRLDGLAAILPDPSIFLYTYVRKEALLSSQIEGTQSSLSDLLLFEIDGIPGVPLDDVVEVSCYVHAMNHGLERLASDFPLSQRLVCEIHEKLLSTGRGHTKLPGQFRRSQNWIGGTRPGNALFVPPPPNYIPDLMSDLEQFIHDNNSAMPNLIKAALIHAQFETIHPFLDGNGRLGRLLITLFLYSCGLLSTPILYLSLFFKIHRSYYYELLQRVRTHGDWEAWIDFFLESVIHTSENATETAAKILHQFNTDHEIIQRSGNRKTAALLIYRVIQERPLITARYAAERAGISLPTAYKAMHHLEKLGIIIETTGKKYNRTYVYEVYWKLLTSDTLS